MAEFENFQSLVNRALQSNSSHMRPVIEKELLHYDILFALDKERLLEDLVFQGGTSLRLCYGSHRFSEDLDFVGGRDFTTAQMLKINECIQDHIGKRYGLKVSVKVPKDLINEPQYHELKIHKWQIRVETAPKRKDIPKQMIKVEIGNIPAYTKTPSQIRSNYDFLPDGYSDIIIMVESLDEILADKVISFVNCQSYIRHRDIWDLLWLKQHNALVSPLIHKKILDYKIENYKELLSLRIESLPNIIHDKAFKNEMSRFLPSEVQERTLDRKQFFELLTIEVEDILKQVKNLVLA